MADNTTLKFIEGFNSLSVAKQFTLLLGFAASIALGVYVVLWSQKPDYIPLFGSMSHKNAGEIVSSLQKTGIPYKLDSSSGLVLVQPNDVHKARIELAMQGTTHDLGTGFEILDNRSSFGTSQFIERTRFLRGLQGELERTISNIRSVKSARVHLSLPKQSSFLRSNQKPGASVFVDLEGGYSLEPSQVAAITNLVASSIQGLQPENVSVIDQSGRLLSGQNSDQMLMVNKRFEYKSQVENLYANRVNDLLSSILGNGRVKAEVTATIDFTSNEKTYENYNPETKAIRSEQTLDIQKGQELVEASGVPGAVSNTPSAVDADGNPINLSEASQDRKKQATRNFEIDRTIGHEYSAPGKLLKLSVAVLVDDKITYNKSGKESRTPLTEDELKNIERLVKDAIGFNEKRGDKVTIVNSSFAQAPPVKELEALPIYKQAWFMPVAKQSGAGLVIIILIFVVIRPFFKNLTNMAAFQQEQRDRLKQFTDELGGDALLEKASSMELEQGESLDINRIREIVKEDPKRVAQLVKTMVGAEND